MRSERLNFKETSQFSRRYTPQIPSQPTPGPTYSSTLKTVDPHQDYYSNREIWGCTTEHPLYHIPNTEGDHLHYHTWAYLKTISQIHIIYHIPRSHASLKRTQPFCEDETLTSSINDLIIDTILEVRQMITTIAESNTQEDPKFHTFLDFLEGDSTFYNFPEAWEGGFGPPEPPETTPPCTNIPYPRINFNFRANMVPNRPWLTTNTIAMSSS